MNIIKLTSENVKRLQAVEITPGGNMVVIGGRNGQGKSSVLDSIEYALGGEPSDKMPVRRGEAKARVILDLGDLVVTRTFTAGGGTLLTVKDADGTKQSSPQAILDKLVGKLTFDPLDFSRQKPEKQAETLRALVGLDFAVHDASRAKLYTERTAVNREADSLKARITGLVKHEDAPEAEQSAADVLKDQQAAQERNRKNEKLREKVALADNDIELFSGNVEDTKAAIASTEQEIAQLQKQLEQEKTELAGAERDLQEARDEKVKAKAAAKDLKDEDLSAFATRLKTIEQTNQKVRDNKARAELVTQYKAKSEAAESLTAQMESLDGKKRKAITEAKYPILGLLFDTAGGVELNGIPFEQCSAAEQLKVSVAIGLALNPKLKVLLVRDGSLLDDDSLAVLAGLAKEAGAQVWVERVGVDAQTSVVIEDGHVAETVVAS